MPRRARLVIPCIPWHIIERGNNRSACFYDTGDYQFYLDTLSEQAVNSDCDIHAFCLMTNHVHLLLTPNVNDSAASLMKQLGQCYAQFINRTSTIAAAHSGKAGSAPASSRTPDTHSFVTGILR